METRISRVSIFLPITAISELAIDNIIEQLRNDFDGITYSVFESPTPFIGWDVERNESTGEIEGFIMEDVVSIIVDSHGRDQLSDYFTQFKDAQQTALEEDEVWVVIHDGTRIVS